MVSFTSSLYDQLKDELNGISIESDNTLQIAERSHRAVQMAIKKLKAFIIEYTFPEREEEILFFKEIKPHFLMERIFYNEVYCFEASKPVGTKETLVGYYEQAINQIQLFFERNQKLYNYYRLGKTHNDDLYFMRQAEPVENGEEFDTRFCTPHSYKLGKIKAFEQFLQYLLSGINEPSNNSPRFIATSEEIPKVVFTGKKVEFTEWLMGIHSIGAINNGNITIKQLFAAFQAFLHINAGNYSSAFQQNIRIRKKDRCVFHLRIIDHLEKKMNNADEYPRYG